MLSYDPAFGFELAVIVREGMRRMYQEQEDIFYYLTLYNENYVMPDMAEVVQQAAPMRQELHKVSWLAAIALTPRKHLPMCICWPAVV